MDDDALQRLGRRITALRQHKPWSLSFLADKAGIAKSSLSRLEQGKGNPTLDTLWRLALQLDIPFSALIATAQSSISDEDVLVSLLDRHQGVLPVDIYLMTLAPEAVRYAVAHAAGTRETLQVIAGRLQAGPDQALAMLEAEGIHQFEADQTHTYRAGPQGATVLVTIFYPQGDGA
ncbi:helix-turn-helix domain-containing protein [Kushneria phyllosphaerae]|uniref:HTH-type transcriptional regulator SutR n=1 Tax=Kushneria phyllosphaerae TaxID=2100822 RepID=A0A2R8CL19_9GAMM|nr:helix-turn-helix transcriptional regulator [Kushneria phyllosphaerae]SPJ33617.1 HTH-type transcriptional regulator SutR [Kushneria phyllosphaerae]